MHVTVPYSSSGYIGATCGKIQRVSRRFFLLEKWSPQCINCNVCPLDNLNLVEYLQLVSDDVNHYIYVHVKNRLKN